MKTNRDSDNISPKSLRYFSNDVNTYPGDELLGRTNGCAPEFAEEAKYARGERRISTSSSSSCGSLIFSSSGYDNGEYDRSNGRSSSAKSTSNIDEWYFSGRPKGDNTDGTVSLCEYADSRKGSPKMDGSHMNRTDTMSTILTGSNVSYDNIEQKVKDVQLLKLSSNSTIHKLSDETKKRLMMRNQKSFGRFHPVKNSEEPLNTAKYIPRYKRSVSDQTYPNYKLHHDFHKERATRRAYTQHLKMIFSGNNNSVKSSTIQSIRKDGQRPRSASASGSRFSRVSQPNFNRETWCSHSECITFNEPEEGTMSRRISRQSINSASPLISDYSMEPDPTGSSASFNQRWSESSNGSGINNDGWISQRRSNRTRSVPTRRRLILNTSKWMGDNDTANNGPRRSNSEEFTPLTEKRSVSRPVTPIGTVPSTPTTPHIVVSIDDEEDQEPEYDDNDMDENRDKSDSSEDLRGDTRNQGLLSADTGQAARHNSITSTAFLSPDAANAEILMSGMYRKTRRNSMIGMMRRASSVNNVGITDAQQQHLQKIANSTSNLKASRNSLAPSMGDWRREGNDAMISCLSALYCKILVVMGLAFPIGEFISGEMPLYIYKGFYLYLHIGSILFLIYAYMFLLRVVRVPKVDVKAKLQSLKMSTKDITRRLSQSFNLLQQQDNKDRSKAYEAEKSNMEDVRAFGGINPFQSNKNYSITESTHESMYLKMGAMAFGIGSMIYSGLELSKYFDLKATPDCADILLVVSPVSRMLFTFIQMYFIFLNSRVAINKHRTIAKFGLMHMIATNLCIWLNVLVEETKHEIHSLTVHAHGDHSELLGKGLSYMTEQDDSNSSEVSDDHVIVRRAAASSGAMYECRQSDMMTKLVDNASPFLFPCTIEYSLLCSGVLYVIWKNINKAESRENGNSGDSDISTFIARKARHHYSVDCAHATRGLFMGILVLVLTIISLILFFVLINSDNLKAVAILEANIIELSVYSVAIITILIGMIQMRELEFVEHGDIELDDILLLIAQTGTYIYTSFTIIGGNFGQHGERILPFCTAVVTLIQTTLQTLFILNASRRCCYTYDQLQRKPGRQMVTFLLICNLAMWAISTFETSRSDAHPTLLNYYGAWAWSIISHVSMPLAIFYRFHATVCLCEIWKRSYKLKHDFI